MSQTRTRALHCIFEISGNQNWARKGARSGRRVRGPSTLARLVLIATDRLK